MTCLSQVAIVVADYDEAIRYFRDKLGFALVEDKAMDNGKRWVVMAPSMTGGARILLAKAKNEAELGHVGNQTGGRVFLFLETDDFEATYRSFRDSGVDFSEEPRDEEYGKVAVFSDLYGNKWDLIGRR